MRDFLPFRPRPRLNLAGKRFGRLIALRDIGGDESKNRIWLCACDCGKEHKAKAHELSVGHVRSCGCLNIDSIIERNTTHGGCYTRLHKTWNNMKARCYIPSSTRYADYGGRGIKVCVEWHDFAKFRDWAEASGYTDKMTIERSEVDGDYEPSNCKWIPLQDQSRNTRRNVSITVSGKTQILSGWLKDLKVSRMAYDGRLRKGMTPEAAIADIIGMQEVDAVTGVRKLKKTGGQARLQLLGKRFGKLVAIQELGPNKHRKIVWLCQCDCGKTTKVEGRDLVKNHTKSCGCSNLIMLGHGRPKTKNFIDKEKI